MPESIPEAIRQAQQAVNRVQSHRIELERTRREVENARNGLVSLVGLLLAWVTPALSLFGIQVHLGPALSGLALWLTSRATHTLPVATSGRQAVLDGVSEAVRIEDEIIKVETQAVEQLNIMHRDLLSSSAMLRTAMIAQVAQGHEETRAVQLENAGTLLNSISASMSIATADIHFRQQRANQAKGEKGRLEGYHIRLDNADDSEYKSIIEDAFKVEGAARREAARNGNQDDGGWPWCPPSCVIL